MKDSSLDDIDSTSVSGTSLDQSPKVQSRNFFPFPIVWFSIAALEISFLAGQCIEHSDIWFHLRNARQLLTTHTFLRADLYTFTTAGAPLLDHQWLSELAYYLAFRAWGLHGLLAVYLVVLWLIFGAVYYLALRRGANCGDAALVTMAAIALGSYSFGPRTHQFGWLCLTVLLLVLERFQRTGKSLWMLPPLFALWINLHGSWVFGFVVMAIYIVSGLVEGQWNNVVAERWTHAQIRQLLVVFGISVVALLANPYGYKLVLYPFDLQFRQKAILGSMAEWQSVDFHVGWGKLAMFMVLSLLAAAWFSREHWMLRDILLSAFALWASLTHLRFLLFAAIILVPILGPRLQLFPPYDAKKDKPWLNLAMTAVIAGIMLWVYPSAAQLQNTIDTQFPRDALRFMQQKQITGRLFHLAEFGGYIEWNAPEIKTFVDGRADIFIYNGVLSDYIKINAIESPFELLDKYDIDYVLFPVNRRLTYLLDRSAGWRTIYEDQIVKIYQRVPGAGTTLRAPSD
jgi:hypothetical protein